ncbi:bacteriophage protein [Burkholderia pseudomallei]|nr:bacteriophage protein [Burkholderia pseudomallei]
MNDSEAIASLVGTLSKFKPGTELKHYISHVRFPLFKSIEPHTHIDFPFPLTALVGANGVGKSSVLHALWGMPRGYSTSRFWFATDLDPIADTQREPQRYIYGHWNDSFGGIVETRKARIGRKLDYWEPYRASVSDGMEPVPTKAYEGKSKDRWNPVQRTSVYINLKATFGSFDRYFYFEDGQKSDEKRLAMLREAKRLKKIVSQNLQSYTMRYERLFENRLLTADELSWTCRILGRDYVSARMVRHSLYPGNRGEDLSVIFDRGRQYSEAFAGSGEVAAVSAVVQVLKAPAFSLILLDEPETSLHPGAQRTLLRFLLEQIKLKKHQIVVSTHSPEFLDGLPANAVKVFEDNGNGHARILGSCSPYVALNRLGKLPHAKKRVLVEDELAKILVRRAAAGLDAGEAQALEILVAPGGAAALVQHHIPAAMTSGDDVFVLLDGDQRKVDAFTPPEQIAPAQYSELSSLLIKQSGYEPKFLIAGGNDKKGHDAAKVQCQLDFLKWARVRLGYLPKLCPEQILLEALYPERPQVTTSKQAKSALRQALIDGAEVSAAAIAGVEELAIARLPDDNEDLMKVRQQLKQWLNGGAG